MNIHVKILPCQAAGLPNIIIIKNKGQKLTKNNQDKRHTVTCSGNGIKDQGKQESTQCIYAYHLETNNLSLFNTDKIIQSWTRFLKNQK